MKHIIVILAAIAVTLTTMAAANNAVNIPLSTKAESAYKQEQYKEALSLYEQSLKSDGISADTYYNIGNCYYRLGEKGSAILNYERALKLDPSHESAKQNIEFVGTKLPNRTASDETNILLSLFERTMCSRSSNSWASIAATLFILLIVCIALYIFANNITIRKIGFFGGFIVLIGCALTLLFAIILGNRINASNTAVITKQSVSLSTSPREIKSKTDEAFTLGEGTKVEILDSIQGSVAGGKRVIWYDVKVDDAHRAWIVSTDVEKI